MSPSASEVPCLPSIGFEAKHANLPKSLEGKTPRGRHTMPDDSFVRHDRYFFKDGNVTFLIDGTLYCVHRYFFSRDSAYFSTRFAQLGIRDHEALPTIISISDVERIDFEALLSTLYPTNFEAHELTYEQWKSVLHLSTRWGFASLRKLALKTIEPPTPHDQLVLARAYLVDQWVLPALTALCRRALPLSLDEACQMKMEDVILVATVREEIRGGALRVDVADIPLHIAKAEAEAQEDKFEAETTAKADAEANAKESKVPKAKFEAVAKAKAEAEARANREGTTTECEALATAEAEPQDKAEAEAREKQEAETEAKAEADAKVADEIKVKAEEEAKVAAVNTESEAKIKVELRDKSAEEKIARQRAADKAARDKAARVANATSSISPAWGSGHSGTWFSKITSAAASATSTEEPASPPKSSSTRNSNPWAKRQARNDPSPRPDLISPAGFPVKHSSTTSSTPHGSVFTPFATPIAVAPPSASVVSSSPALGGQERKLTNDKQDGKAGYRNDNQATAALPAEVVDGVHDEAERERAMTTANQPVPSKTTDVSKPCCMVGGAAALVAPGRMYADPDSTHLPFQAESTRTQVTEVVANFWPSKDLEPASSFHPPTLTPRQPSPIPESLTLPLIVRGVLLGKYATITKEHTPTPELAASVSSKPNGEPLTLNILDAKKVEEAPAQTAPSSATQDGGVKPDEATTGLTRRLSQRSEAGGMGSAITKGDNAHPVLAVKPTLRLDHIRELSAASATSASDPGVPGDAPSYLLNSDVPGTTLTRPKGRKMRDKARKQHAQMELRNNARPPSEAPSNSVDNLVAQELKLAPVDIPIGKGEGVRVGAKTESGKNGALVVVGEPDVATTAEMATARADDDDDECQWAWFN